MPHELPTLNLPESATLHLDQYLGLWAMDEARASQLYQHVSSLDISAHIAANTGKNLASAKGELRGEVAIIDISGTITKRGSSLSDAGSTIRIRQEIRKAVNDSEISGIILRVDSPGGTLSGVADLAADVYAANQAKPVVGFAEDLAASAAYWVLSQCRAIYANNRTAEIGSIGVYMGLYDVSRKAENEGIKPVVIRTSTLKGSGFPGEPVTEEQKAYWQEEVDNAQAEFTGAIQRGRSMTASQVEAVATGRVFSADKAQQLGLIDGIKSFDEVVAHVQTIATTSKPKGKPMAGATYLELLEACDGIDPKTAEDAVFLAGLQNREATADEARKAWMGELRSRAEKAREAQAAAEEQARTAAESEGVEPLTDEGGNSQQAAGDGSAKSEFWAAVEEKQGKGLSKNQAISRVVSEKPDLHKAMLAETNQNRA